MASADVILDLNRVDGGDSDQTYPWFKFWPAAWMGDECLRMCSLAAHGLLLAFMCLMHKAVPYGHLLVNGRKPTDQELARLVGASTIGELRRLRAELVDRCVVSQTPDGILFSRRMVRDRRRAAIGRETGRKGGNPSLLPQAPLTQPLAQPLSEPSTQTLSSLDNHKKIEERREIPPVSPQGGSGDDRSGADQLFERFWDVYPHKVSRKAALREWQKIRPVPNEAFTGAVVAAVERHRRDWKDPKFIPHPSTWLRNARWEDQDTEPASAGVPICAARTVAGADETAILLAAHRKAGGRG